MAKHAHRLMLNQKKTWRCTLPNCRYFIHIGLAHILPGQQHQCWGCGEEHTLDEDALKDEQPMCSDCHARAAGQPTSGDLEKYIEAKLALARSGVKSVKELDPIKRGTLIAVAGISEAALDRIGEVEKDVVEVIEPDEVHYPDCDVYAGGECTCK